MSDRRGKRKEKEKVVSKDATTNATMTWKSKNTKLGGSGLTPYFGRAESKRPGKPITRC